MKSNFLPDYLPIEVIFNLLCVCRRIQATTTQSVRRAMYRRGLYSGTFEMLPDFGFWIALCQAAALLDEGQPPRPTLLVPDWLALTWQEQYHSLIEAWQRMPANPGVRFIRSQLLPMLLEDAELSVSYQRELGGLQALAICDNNALTTWGFEFLHGKGIEKAKIPIKAWRIQDGELNVPYAPDWALLWDLEDFLAPIDPGIYPLDEKSLRRIVQQAESGRDDFLHILEKGLECIPPDDLVENLKSQPTLKVLPGVVLEFSSRDELNNLRQNASMRKSLASMISPHHVYVDTEQAERVLKQLLRCGLLSYTDLQSFYRAHQSNPASLSTSERAYLLCILLTSQGMGIPIGEPPGLSKKLADGLPFTLRAAAARKADKAIRELMPQAAWVPDAELPPIPDTQTLRRLEEYLQNGGSIDILYRKTEQSQPDHRRVTPLVIEQRGLRFYLIAYCHNRRARRTFRIDRLQLVQEPPQT